MSAGTMTELDLDTFLKELEEYDSAKCESQHKGKRNGQWVKTGECSIDAVARVSSRCDGNSVLWCQNKVDQFHRDSQSVNCNYCKRVLADCWTVRPV